MAAVLLVGFGAYRFLIAPATAPKAATYTVKRENLSETLSLSGKIDATEKATLKFQTAGYLAWVGAKQGDHVKKFQTLASLDQAALQKTMNKYLSSFVTARLNYDSAKEDYNDNFTTDLKRAYEKAQANLDSSVMDVEIQNLAVKYANLWTPIDGLVTVANFPQAGVNVLPTQNVFEVVNPGTIYFSTTADQTDVVKLSPSQSGEITFDAYPNQPIKATITDISFAPKTDETGTVYEVKMDLPVDNSGYLYRLGMTGDAAFVARQIPNAIAIPAKYVKSNSDGSKYVWLIANGQKMKKSITIGDNFDAGTEIKTGLVEGNVISEN